MRNWFHKLAFALMLVFSVQTLAMRSSSTSSHASSATSTHSPNPHAATASLQGASTSSPSNPVSTPSKSSAPQKMNAQPDTVAQTNVKRTTPVEITDYDKKTTDLKTPENIQEETTYDDKTNTYWLGSKMGDSYLNAPMLMTPEEYQQWSLKRSMAEYYRRKNEEAFTNNGKEKFDFADMKFDLGPAEKIFGPGGVRIKTQGSAELKFGANMKNEQNPSIPVRNRKTFGFDFDEKINMNLNGKVGDKLNMNLNYNTEGTFDYDAKNLKLKYEGKEDEIIKLVEAGNVSMPTNSSLIKGGSSLFGVRTDMQFGKLKLQTVFSQKKSTSKTVSSKGGSQMHNFEIKADEYVENRFFFLSHYFRDHYDQYMASLPNITSGITIKRVEVWVTNKNGSYENQRNIIGFTDLGEPGRISNTNWSAGTISVPCNQANTEYATLTQQYADARYIDQTNALLDGIQGFEGGRDYEKLQSARKLNANEYTVNKALGYIMLRTTLQPDEVLAVAYEYTYGGNTYQVGEFATDITDSQQALFVKTLKNTNNSPSMGNWDLMMKNVYQLGGQSIQKDKFKLDIKYQSDSTGVYLTYLPEGNFKNTTLLKMMNLDRLDNNNKLNPNGAYDFVEGFTFYATNGFAVFPVVEPFGNHLRKKLGNGSLADKYCYDELYDSTKTIAKQIAEKDKYILTGRYKGSNGAEIDLGSGHIPRGSVVVTAGGVTLTENSDYTVDYSQGRVTIINQSIIDAGTNVTVSTESNDFYGMQRKTMMGLNWEYDFSKNFILGGTFMHLKEQALTTKVAMGDEPLSNTLWGLNLSWKKESQWLTNMLDKLPFLHCTAPSQINFTGEFAQLIAGKASGTQGNASYLDDFENTKNGIDVRTPTAWTISSTPSDFPESSLSNDVQYGFNRARLAWYYIDPLFTRRSSTLTPSHIKSDLEQLSNLYVREVYERELYPNKSQNVASGSSATLPLLNLAYYPTERGPYNLNPDLTYNGKLNDPKEKWGGMMRRLETSDFEMSNIEYLEFWLLDPFAYTRNQPGDHGGDFYINLGEISEDILKDGKKFYESGMPIDGNPSYYTTTVWGRVPTQNSVTYAFNNSSGSREKQDVGFNGLSSEDEKTFGAYKDFLSAIQGKVSPAVFDSIMADPAGDDYHYFRGGDYDQAQLSILDRYKYINNPEGNSPDANNSPERYDTSYKTNPDAEDINADYTLNEYEKYFQYHISMRPEDMVVGKNYIVDKRVAMPTLRNGQKIEETWYQFRVPVKDYEKRVGGINDFTSIRFMRMFLTQFEEPIVLRFATLDLIRADWRPYEQALYTTSSSSGSGSMDISAVNFEENGKKTPVNYVLPPGITRVVDPSQSQLNEANEQALSLVVKNLAGNDARAVYKNTNIDFRSYKHLQLFVHANALEDDVTNLQNGQTSVFVRLGSDYKSNFYEYEIPLTLTPANTYDNNSTSSRKAVWPEENMLDIDLSKLTAVKKNRNIAKNNGEASFNRLFSEYDADRPNNKMSIMGNPSLGEVSTIMIGVKNNTAYTKSVEVWVNEFRLQDPDNNGGWAAQGNLNVILSDFGTVNVTGHMETEGFGGLEEKVNSRRKDNFYEYNITTNLQLGKFFPEKAKVNAPLYYSYSKEVSKPKYNPLNTDMLLDDALEACANQAEKDSVNNIAVKKITTSNLSFSNVKVNIGNKRHPMPWDPANFAFSYSQSKRRTTGETTAWEKEENWRGSMNYNYAPIYKPFEPFKKMKSKSKWWELLRAQNFNYLPQNVMFNTEMTRSYYELQERDMDNLSNNSIPISFSEQFLWNRRFSLTWNLTKAIHMQFTSATNAEIEEPYTVLNKSLYPDEYAAWKDSVAHSIRNLGRPLDYQQTFSLSYQVPINLIPCFDWMNLDGNFNSSYNWTRGTDLQDGTNLGNTINNQRAINLNGRFNMETLYNHIPFLKETNQRFSANNNNKKVVVKKNTTTTRLPNNKKDDKKDGKKDDSNTANAKKTKGFSKEVTLVKDSVFTITHNLNTQYIDVTAVDKQGKKVKVKYKMVDPNKITIAGKDSVTFKLNIARGTDPHDTHWYKAAQHLARVAMMVRNVSLSYRNTQSMYLPGFMPNIGDVLGQRNQGGLIPGLDFAFGLTDESYIARANERGWLLNNDSISSNATTNTSEDLQVRVTLEPFRDFKIDLNASRTVSKASSIQYMYAGMPTTRTGSFNMTTISLGSAFSGSGNADNNYKSSSFDKFVQLLDVYQQRVESRYNGIKYPVGTSLAGQEFDPANGTVSKYSADVMIPAFLEAYTSSGKGLDFFPSLTKMLPNWTISYNGLGKLAWLRDHFKSVTISHGYKSVFAIGSYNTFTSWVEYMDGLGFNQNVTTGQPIPSSMYDVSTVSVNESFSPLIGLNLTFNNNLTTKVEYRKTRVLNLSMTSALLSETCSNDFVVGMGYKINDFKMFNLSGTKTRKAKGSTRNRNAAPKKENTATNKKGMNHDLNMRMDFSLRNQSALSRNIQTGLSEATSGNKALKISFSADYTLSRLLTMSAYYNRQTNTPLLSTSAYPTTTQDFGINIKFSLSR